MSKLRKKPLCGEIEAYLPGHREIVLRKGKREKKKG